MAYTTIDKPDDYFNTVLYTGNGSTQSITGVGFQPDFVWCKTRSIDKNHNLFDVVRGVQKRLLTNHTNSEDTISGVTSFDSDGFSIGSNTNMNTSSATHVSWNWLAGGTASSNTDGSITSSVSANPTAGFSIVSYTGTGANATVGHSLGSTPAMIIWKNRSQTNGWITYHHKNTSAPETDYLELHVTNATNDLNTIMNDTAPTSSVFTVGTEGAVNNSGNNFIAYCFAEKKGYSKFGSYTGNGNNDGTFVYTGFKPAFFMAKKTSGTGAWTIHDNKRNVDNPIGKALFANSSEVEYNYSGDGTPIVDFISNGFKYRGTASGMNASSATYIYMAFAENPFVTSTGICCTAR